MEQCKSPIAALETAPIQIGEYERSLHSSDSGSRTFIDKGTISPTSRRESDGPNSMHLPKRTVQFVGLSHPNLEDLEHLQRGPATLEERMRELIQRAPPPDQVTPCADTSVELSWSQQPPCTRYIEGMMARLFLSGQYFTKKREEVASPQCITPRYRVLQRFPGASGVMPRVLKYAEIEYLSPPLNSHRYKITNHLGAKEQVHISVLLESKKRVAEPMANKTLIIKGNFAPSYGTSWDTLKAALYHDTRTGQTCVCTAHYRNDEGTYWLGIWNLTQALAQIASPSSPTSGSNTNASSLQKTPPTTKTKAGCCTIA